MIAGTTARRFPLVARSRPLCTALPARIGALADLAAKAHHHSDLTAAARVYNQAALIASDCGQPDLARQWCHRHARAWLNRRNLSTTPGRHVIEPLVNLARLHIRAGEHDDGLALLTELYHAVAHRTDTTIDGIHLPTAALTPTHETHRNLTQWLWTVHLAEGARVLTSAGRWDEAEAHLQHHHGIGNRMLDGRQVAIIARIQRGQHEGALRIIDQTQNGEAWEAAVGACLTAMCRVGGPRAVDIGLMAARYQEMSADPPLIVFRTRLALSMIELAGGPSGHGVKVLARRTIDAAVTAMDGYAARDILSCSGWATTEPDARQALLNVLAESGLDRPLPAPLLGRLTAVLAQTDAVISNAEPISASESDRATPSPDAGGITRLRQWQHPAAEPQRRNAEKPDDRLLPVLPKLMPPPAAGPPHA
ncbi:hypothetical protein [Micromonospora sp. WMMD980]|uniref:hypothetical protein n=1 Tax=Micromonospora sp. WMMD980 TaxID=3016088 RepID=UPI00241758CB|nr:hypothetical protein [Micromonospora sp. WMMD980]MDG4803706.1 hypothetical protein [Micromonospora sp. WMMD980]